MLSRNRLINFAVSLPIVPTVDGLCFEFMCTEKTTHIKLKNSETTFVIKCSVFPSLMPTAMFYFCFVFLNEIFVCVIPPGVLVMFLIRYSTV